VQNKQNITSGILKKKMRIMHGATGPVSAAANESSETGGVTESLLADNLRKRKDI